MVMYMEIWDKIEEEIESDKIDYSCIIEKLKELGYSENDIKTGRINMKDLTSAIDSCEIRMNVPIKKIENKLKMIL